MKTQVLQEDLAKAINIASRFVSPRVQLPVLANILLETSKNKFRVNSTNLEVSVSVTIGSKTEEDGNITVPSKIISEIVSNLKSGQTSLNSEKERLQIKQTDYEATISGMNSSDFPSIPREKEPKSLKIDSSYFNKALAKILFSVSGDETRPVLTGILLIMKKEEVVFVATDGFRLSQKKIKLQGNSEEKKIIIPKSTLSEIPRILTDKEIELSFNNKENQVLFTNSNIVLSSRVIEGEFPDFEKIVPKSSKIKLNLDKYEFLRAIKLASVFARDSANVVKLNVSKDSLELTAESQQYGSQKGKVDAKTEGDLSDGFTVAFNFRFLEEFLNACEGDDVQIEFSDPNSPVLFLDSKDKDYLHIIMPVRLQS